MNLDLLAIAAHPDDVELTCGGTLLKMAQRGYKTGILDLTAAKWAPAARLRLAPKRLQKPPSFSPKMAWHSRRTRFGCPALPAAQTPPRSGHSRTSPKNCHHSFTGKPGIPTITCLDSRL